MWIARNLSAYETGDGASSGEVDEKRKSRISLWLSARSNRVAVRVRPNRRLWERPTLTLGLSNKQVGRAAAHQQELRAVRSLSILICKTKEKQFAKPTTSNLNARLSTVINRPFFLCIASYSNLVFNILYI